MIEIGGPCEVSRSSSTPQCETHSLFGDHDKYKERIREFVRDVREALKEVGPGVGEAPGTRSKGRPFESCSRRSMIGDIAEV